VAGEERLHSYRFTPSAYPIGSRWRKRPAVGWYMARTGCVRAAMTNAVTAARKKGWRFMVIFITSRSRPAPATTSCSTHRSGPSCHRSG